MDLYLDKMKLLAQELASSYGEQREGNINIPGIQQKKEVLEIELEIDKLIDAENKEKAEQQLLIKQKELNEKG